MQTVESRAVARTATHSCDLPPYERQAATVAMVSSDGDDATVVDDEVGMEVTALKLTAVPVDELMAVMTMAMPTQFLTKEAMEAELPSWRSPMAMLTQLKA